jgi:hypothetical protein
VVVVEPERRWDSLAELGERLVGGELDLPPDASSARRGIEAAQDADAENGGG